MKKILLITLFGVIATVGLAAEGGVDFAGDIETIWGVVLPGQIKIKVPDESHLVQLPLPVNWMPFMVTAQPMPRQLFLMMPPEHLITLKEAVTWVKVLIYLLVNSGWIIQIPSGESELVVRKQPGVKPTE